MSDRSAHLPAISTEWSKIDNPAEFVIRYASAIQRYLRALVGNEHDADEAAQEFLLKVTRQGFQRVSADRGRFRDYLIAAVRNAALSHLRHKRVEERRMADTVDRLLPEEAQEEADRAYQQEWQRCILDKAWRSLHRHERSSPGNLAYTTLKLTSEFPHEDSAALAERASKASGAALGVEAFRKQVSRARRLFAELIFDEVRSTLDNPVQADVEAELAEVGLMVYVKPYLSQFAGH
jgi:DNA-directed RNA polymerase specialized sigma24 family protein